MTAQVNITVSLDLTGGTVLYTAVQASGGDNSPAIWRNLTVGVAAGHKPELRFSTRNNGPKTARRADIQFTYPQLVTASDGSVTVKNRLNATLSVVIPTDMADADISKAIAQFVTALSVANISVPLAAGYAPT